MQAPSVVFRLDRQRRARQLQQFNAREEIAWFGFEGVFEEPGSACITFRALHPGSRGGGGSAALNGGVIAAGFDAVFVLAGLGHYDSEVVVTLELSVKFLSLALSSEPLAFRAQVVRSAKHFSFAQGFLTSSSEPAATHYAIASAMVAPR
jgi:acyl-coenzyme A thioesterase PaaI-like protein